MTIYQLFEDGILHLPLEPNKNEDFKKCLFDKFEAVIPKIQQLTLASAMPDKDKEKIVSLIDGIRTSISLYLNGKPPSAYTALKEAIDKSLVFDYLISSNYPARQNLYRLRIKDSNYHLPKNELFHVPFDLRNSIGTQRYSIPGFPCLYLANSLYVAWEEMRRPDLNKLQAIRFQNNVRISYLDLTSDIYSNDFNVREKTEDELIINLKAWPLIAACSVKVTDKNAYFKPEYIIPQLLLQWIRNEKTLDAIRFSSSHIDLNKTMTKGTFYNFVIPVKDNGDAGHCNSLLDMFKSTEVVSWQLHQTSSGADLSKKHTKPINNDIQEIEIITGIPMPYESSPLSILEYKLNKMKLDQIS